jgi:hypothetical protein
MNCKNDSLKSRSATLKTPGLKVDEVYLTRPEAAINPGEPEKQWLLYVIV